MTNLLPPLSDQEYEALKADIARRGVMVPVEVDAETGAVLDGFHRMRACRELGIEPPVVRRSFGTDQERQEHAIALNLVRRQLGPVAWAAMFKQLLEVRGVPTGRGAVNRYTRDPSSATVAELAAEVGVPERTARYRLELAEKLEARPDLAEKVNAREITAREALRQVVPKLFAAADNGETLTGEEAAAMLVEGVVLLGEPDEAENVSPIGDTEERERFPASKAEQKRLKAMLEYDPNTRPIGEKVGGIVTDLEHLAKPPLTATEFRDFTQRLIPALLAEARGYIGPVRAFLDEIERDSHDQA